jgi:hypothetical protein
MLLICLVFCLSLFFLFISILCLVPSVAYVSQLSILGRLFGLFYSCFSVLFSYVGPNIHNKLTSEFSVEQLSRISNPWGRVMSEIYYLYHIVSSF